MDLFNKKNSGLDLIQKVQLATSVEHETEVDALLNIRCQYKNHRIRPEIVPVAPVE